MTRENKFFIFLTTFILIILFSVAPAKAMTAEELKQKIVELQTQIAALRAQLAELQGNSSEWCYDFNANLSYGSSGVGVEALKKALEAENLGAVKFNDQFDETLASAVSGFQEKYREEVLTPLGLKYGTGYVGGRTRAKLNSLYGCGVAISGVTVDALVPLSATLQVTTDNINWRSELLGPTPLNGVDLKATITSGQSGPFVYKFDCTNDGVFEYVFDNVNDNQKIVTDACDYPSRGVYTTLVRVEKGSSSFNRGTAVRALQTTVDLKVNGSDGPLTVAYNSPVTLTWSTADADSCTASSEPSSLWSGTKSTAGTETSSSPVTSARTYILTCVTNYSTGSDRVTVDTIKSLTATLEATTDSTNWQKFNLLKSAPVDGVDLKATVTSDQSGPFVYKFDCTNDGIFEYVFDNVNDNQKIVTDACNYPSRGTYTANVRVEKGNSSINAAIVVRALQTTVDLKVNGSNGPLTVTYNSPVTLTWTSTEADKCIASSEPSDLWSGTKLTTGTETSSPVTSARTYILTCVTNYSTGSDRVTVTIP